MENHKNIKYFLLIIILQLCCFPLIYGQTVVNNGAKIVIRDGANVIIGGNYINKNDGLFDGEINLDGNIFLRKSWLNNANNEVLVSVGTGPTGNLIMDASTNQFIGGSHSSTFENIVLINSRKLLDVSDCKVNDTLQLNSVLDLNTHRIKILNSNPAGIKYFSGYILGETNTFEGLGEVEWYIGSHLDSTYIVPFGSGFDAGPDVKITLKTKTAGQPANGSIVFATYPTGIQNFPLPPAVPELDRGPEYIADRFWNIDPIYDNKPDVGMIFHYRSKDINESGNGGLVEADMKAIRYNTLMDTWTDMLPVGVSDPGQKLFLIENLGADNFYAPWCLVSEEIKWQIYFSTAFSPNGDGVNDYFAPIGENLDKLDLKMYIYNRWGGLMYTMDDINKPWNGHSGTSKNVCPPGVYNWILFLKSPDGVDHMYKGIVALIN
jgi:gliding motility-associated-like protein